MVADIAKAIPNTPARPRSADVEAFSSDADHAVYEPPNERASAALPSRTLSLRQHRSKLNIGAGSCSFSSRWTGLLRIAWVESIR
ncbi:hypothetical protein PsYK624_166330 [Phanerochaete sordida]|uniref:Uncharacterized protein n=1 Tax=Phanerochaete sordida TaxID=48140 RepID=A0A9P3LNV3_9APHY|nr:hypothetical protein PsYK624_166330 [Phanerochaete sordida]